MLVMLLLSCEGNDNPTGGGNTGFTPAGMKLITAKDRSFQIGSINGFPDELPIHTVRFSHDFWMDTTEVTQADYDTLMRHSYSGYVTPGWFSTYGVGARYPAYSIYWGDAALYCNARSRRDGLDTVYRYTGITGTPGNMCELVGVTIDYTKNGYRLPTEAEWEYACRGGVNADFFWGKNINPYPSDAADSAEISSYAIWSANSWQFGSDTSAFGTHQVATKTPNQCGLYGMAGNVYEWCNDWYDSYQSGTVVDPAGPDSGLFRCMRGGSWGNDATYLRSANRTIVFPDYNYYFIGFRAVRPVP